MLLRIIAVLFGIGLICIGVAGFLEVFKIGNLLFGLFQVNAVQNIFHIVSGVIAIMCATSLKFTKLFFQIFGIIYILIALIGFWRNDLWIMHVNLEDNILHLGMGLIALYLGFGPRFKTVS